MTALRMAWQSVARSNEFSCHLQEFITANRRASRLLSPQSCSQRLNIVAGRKRFDDAIAFRVKRHGTNRRPVSSRARQPTNRAERQEFDELPAVWTHRFLEAATAGHGRLGELAVVSISRRSPKSKIFNDCNAPHVPLSTSGHELSVEVAFQFK